LKELNKEIEAENERREEEEMEPLNKKDIAKLEEKL